jgi:hypothetical protein
MMNTPEVNFWLAVVENTLKVARKLPGVTDSHLRSKMASYHALVRLEQRLIDNLLRPEQLNPNSVLKLPPTARVRQRYERHYARLRKLRNLHEFYQTILHARLYLKGDGNIAVYLVSLLAPDEVEYRRRQMEEEFPE